MAKTVIVRNGEDSEANALAWIVLFLVLGLGAYVLVSGSSQPKHHLKLAVDEVVPVVSVAPANGSANQ